MFLSCQSSKKTMNEKLGRRGRRIPATLEKNSWAKVWNKKSKKREKEAAGRIVRRLVSNVSISASQCFCPWRIETISAPISALACLCHRLRKSITARLIIKFRFIYYQSYLVVNVSVIGSRLNDSSSKTIW